MVKEIVLQNGMKAIVDDEDFDRVNKYNWTVHKHSSELSLSVRGHVLVEGKKKTTRLNHFILGMKPNDKQAVTHLNKNLLDFRKNNLQIVSRRHISHCIKARKNCSSDFKGVSWDKATKKWLAGIQVDGRRINLGRFAIEEEAAVAYNKAALKYFGEHAYQNNLDADNTGDVINMPLSSIQRLPKKDNKSSRFRGVTFYRGKWRARCSYDNQRILIGDFADEIDAAEAYNEKAKEVFGDKAILNEIETKEENHEI
ncbi:AP2 domain-containing protein [Bacillus testis]|uniref:AP2 domain-containing protein n=1 Tax=Bacillus testis TaxID=1622072 RepID=UPI00067F4E79|nr:AP2 domain-containing protein [Bacillus testis]